MLWLWCRPAATALIGLLAWEPPYASGVALKRQKKKKKKRKQEAGWESLIFRRKVSVNTIKFEIYEKKNWLLNDFQ